MTTMKRRQFVGRVGLGSAALVSAAAGVSSTASGQGAHDHHAIEGPLASATVSFGEWPATGSQPLDRMALPTAPMAPNLHMLVPNTATIQAGGTVNFVVAGFHQIAVYAPGTTPADINPTRLPPTPIPNAPPAVFLIDDPVNRLYRGLNPIGESQDRVEAVHFGKAGQYLVMCLVSVHFLNDKMFGWVRVLP
jgi:plastocyanin